MEAAMKRWIAPDRPSDFPARLTMYLGWASFVPPFTPLTALIAACTGILSHALCTRYPERYTGKPKVYLGLLLTIVAMALFVGEAALFLRWKEQQAYQQRLTVSRFRLDEISQALERYREEKGVYPDAPTLLDLKEKLEPLYLSEVPTKDGFDGTLSGESRAEGFVLQCLPPPPRQGGQAPPPLEVRNAFQPAPAPPPPPVLDVNAPDVNALDVNAPVSEAGEAFAGGTSEGTGEAPGPPDAAVNAPVLPEVTPSTPTATP